MTYNGRNYDDVDEARHAFFFDTTRLTYDTQPRIVEHPLLMNESNTTGIYRTDFYVHDIGYLEVTGPEPTLRKWQTCEILAKEVWEQERRHVYLVWGGLYPAFRSTTQSPKQAMKICKFLVEPMTSANGSTYNYKVSRDYGYAWVYWDGKVMLDKINDVMDNRWNHLTFSERSVWLVRKRFNKSFSKVWDLWTIEEASDRRVHQPIQCL